ncbi:hypothetical protein [Streptomyces sp. NPDC002851]
MQMNDDASKVETTLPDGRRMTLSLPATGGASGAPWAADGITALRVVPATHTGRGDEPQPLPASPVLPFRTALLGLAAL